MYYTNNMPLFNKAQIENQLLKQEEFLKIIHPFLNENNFNEECVEIRPILRDFKSDTKYIKSLNLWRVDEEGRERHLKFLEKINGQAICLYYSGFVFDYNKVVLKKDGKEFKKGKINNQNSIYTTILPIDFDNITLMEHQEQIQIINSLGIEMITIYTGHGYQDLILLDNKCYDKEIYKKFTYLLLSKGFKADENIIDPARVLRLPHTFNCKAFDPKNKYADCDAQPIPSKRISTTIKRYNLKEIFRRIETLKTKSNEYEKRYKELFNINTINFESEDLTKNKVKEKVEDIIEFVSISDQYKMINFKDMPEGIKNMLTETPINYRNSVMMFLIPFFKNTLGLSLEMIIEIMKVWGKRCKPNLEKDFVEQEVKRIYIYNNKAAIGKYSIELAKRFGYIDFEEYNKYEIDNKIKISNEFIDHYNIISDGSVRIYLMMKLFEKVEEIKIWTEEDIIKCSKISRRTFYRNIEDLIKCGFVDKKRSVKQLGDKYIYYINKHYNKSLGFTLFNISTLRMMVYDSVKPLNNAEIKTYTYICKMISNNPTQTCWASQETLGEYICKKRNSLTRITTDLNNKNYIKKDKYKGTDGYEYCVYTLMY